MQRYFIKKDQLVDDQATITGDDVHHIKEVMRARVGDDVILCTSDQRSYLVKITDLNATAIQVKVVEKKEENVELPIFVTIAQGMMKGDKFEWAVQKATECGASTFIPVEMKRSVARVEAKRVDKRVKRWQKIALEAARQSHRQLVPEVKVPIGMKDLIEVSAAYDVCLFAYEAFAHAGVSQCMLADVIATFSPGERVLVLIGPEGGIDDVEARMLTEAGFSAVGLGPRILRAETAPIYMMSVMSYAMELCRSTHQDGCFDMRVRRQSLGAQKFSQEDR